MIEQLHILTNEVLRVYPSGSIAAAFLNVSQVHTANIKPLKWNRSVSSLSSCVHSINPLTSSTPLFWYFFQSGISLCCSGTKPDAYGFKWRFYEGPSIDCKITCTQTVAHTPTRIYAHTDASITHTHTRSCYEACTQRASMTSFPFIFTKIHHQLFLYHYDISLSDFTFSILTTRLHPRFIFYFLVFCVFKFVSHLFIYFACWYLSLRGEHQGQTDVHRPAPDHASHTREAHHARSWRCRAYRTLPRRTR